MSRIQLQLPETFSFSTTLTIRITDLNYGNHLGNDALLGLIHEARVQFLQSYSYTEMNTEGVALIMSDAAIEFKSEGFYGDSVKIYVTATDFSRVGFSIFYKLVKGTEEKTLALAKTGMVCFNYTERKVTSLPAGAFADLRKTN